MINKLINDKQINLEIEYIEFLGKTSEHVVNLIKKYLVNKKKRKYYCMLPKSGKHFNSKPLIN